MHDVNAYLTQGETFWKSRNARNGNTSFANAQKKTGLFFRRSLNTVAFHFTAVGILFASGFTCPPALAQPQGGNFTLTNDATTSAGVYAADGTLVRTLWSNVRFSAGTHPLTWDGLDDRGNTVTGTGLYPKLIAHNVNYVWEGVIGNTSADLTGPYKHRSFFFINDMKITGTNGVLCTGYNELQTMLYHFHSTNYQSRAGLIDFEDYRRSFAFCDTDGELAYFGNIGGAEPATFVFAANLTNNSRWNFSTGVNYDPWTSVIDDGTNALTGLAVQKRGNYLFVARRDNNVVKVFHKKTGVFVKNIAVATPGALTVNTNDELWVASTNNGTVKLFANLTNSPKLSVTIPGFSWPLALGVSPLDNTLVVADGGTNHQLKGFNQSGIPQWTYGQPGGYPANGANVATNKFWFQGSFLAFNADGSFWVGDNGNSRAMLFDRFRNHKDNLQYLPHTYSSGVDLGNPTRVFGDWLEFSVDYSKPLQQSWAFTRNWQAVLPANISLQGIPQLMTMTNGRTYTLLIGKDAQGYNETVVMELQSNGFMRECGRLQTDWYTIQPDGSLRTFGYVSGGYLPLYRKRLSGFDAGNNPLWGPEELLVSVPVTVNDDPWPRGFSGSLNPRYNITASGLIPTFATFRGSFWHLGALRTNSNTFLWRAMPEGAWQTDSNGWIINPTGTFDPAPEVSYAGNQTLVSGRNIVAGYNGEFWSGGQANQWLHFYDNGLFVGQFGRPLFPAANHLSASAGTAGNAFSPTLILVSGKLYLYHNDESAHAGIHRWRVDGWDQIAEMSLSFTGSPTNHPPTVSLTSPANLDRFTAPANITINASAVDTDGTTSKVEFFQGVTKLGEDTASPFSFTWANAPPGQYALAAVATDNSGAATVSAPVNISVTAPGITAPTRLGNGSFQMSLTGTVGRTNTIQASADLKTWTMVTNLFNNTGALLFNDALAGNYPQRFYRVNVESVLTSNAVGFVSVVVPPGYSTIANQLNAPTNTVAHLFPNVPGGTTISKFRNLRLDFSINSYDPDFLAWDDDNQPFVPGEAAFIRNPTAAPFIVTFVGDVPEGALTTAMPGGYSMIASQVPQAGLLQTALKFPGVGGDIVYVYRNGGYLISRFYAQFNLWDAEPNVNVGEGFFLFKTTATNWVRNFSAHN